MTKPEDASADATAQTAFDVAVVGAGSAGISFARHAAGNGARVLLIERDALGGTCVNRGCVPKKLLWHAARSLRETGDLRRMGLIGTSPPPFDLGRWQQLKNAKIDAIHGSYEESLADAGVNLRRGDARVERNGRVVLDGQPVRAERTVLATGSRPVMLSFEGADAMQDSSDVLSWTRLPRRLAIVGGGYIGCEFATIFNALGCEVTLLDESDALLSGFDEDAVALASAGLQRHGVDVRLGTAPERIERLDGGLRVHLEDGSQVDAEAVVCAVGRRPDLEALGPIADRLETGESGAVSVGDRFETSVPGVHAIGDIADRLPLTPVATRDGETLAVNLFGSGESAAVDLDHVARAVFTMPPVAQVGIAAGDGVTIDKGCSEPLHATVLAPRERIGECQLYKLARRKGTLVGAVLVSDHAPDAIGALAPLVADGAAAATLTGAVPIHPTFSEEFIGTS